ncbi:MAG: Hsp33 family molecular chaperone HslO [Candidatus Eremiobacteraeota bacterium]|nr:Hsp33 family molecular chaperone HslO [Candidatus Eremiobacteraeota bacterium]
MHDCLITASAPGAGVAFVAGITTRLVREVQVRHALSPTASAAVGRLMSGAALLGTSLKGRERISLQIAGDGPLRGIVADVMTLRDGRVGVRGYAKNPHVDVPLNESGKFDVRRAVGNGSLQVTKSYEVGQPYVGIVPLVSGEIAEDLASYLLNSQQVPSVVALGVLADRSGIVAAGGIIGQVLPGADEDAIRGLEQRAKTMLPITTQIADGADPSALLHSLGGDLEFNEMHQAPVEFACRCTRERVEVALLGLGRDELLKMASERPQTEATCEFCKQVYVLSSAEVSQLVERLKKA